MTSTESSRFEVVHAGPARFHARFVAANGETVWVTESYTRRRAAREAIYLLNDSVGGTSWIAAPSRILEVDERGGP